MRVGVNWQFTTGGYAQTCTNLNFILLFKKFCDQYRNKFSINNSFSAWTHVCTHFYCLVGIPSCLINIVIKLRENVNIPIITASIRPCHTAAILSRETKKALFYHAKPRSQNRRGEAWRGKTKLFWSSGTIWPPCDKGEWRHP